MKDLKILYISYKEDIKEGYLVGSQSIYNFNDGRRTKFIPMERYGRIFRSHK